ncbi:hypothetical protein C9374_005560 [Naegleria lovaniensis]|uniref:Peptidase S1 domain-containing protein n=1 Tax=Naegleria lovaniensis TaxID=51637 RepID=A0AA88GPV4_NAELO|nr:uncharacterized protein C9374_005560 [Naegleria lovaniensis]KAG2382358.1 hypothetical protein C9374_005560 [Naegleria lovaniensis]
MFDLKSSSLRPRPTTTATSGKLLLLGSLFAMMIMIISASCIQALEQPTLSISSSNTFNPSKKFSSRVPQRKRQQQAFSTMSSSSSRSISIAGGSVASSHEFPFIVSIQQILSSTVSAHFCGGSVIAPNYILTAAHCVYDDNGNLILPTTVRVFAGSSSSSCSNLANCNYKNAQAIYPHPNYNSNTLENDIALIKLSGNLQIDGTNTRLAYIESGSVPLTKNFAATVAGWGYIDSTNTVQTNLMKVQVPVQPASVCNGSPLYLGMSSPMQVCAGDGAGHDACPGDSGGPLFRSFNSSTNDFVVFGVVSYGPDGCGAGYATNRGVYTNTTYYLNSFIKQYVPSVQTSSYSSSSGGGSVTPAVSSPKPQASSNNNSSSPISTSTSKPKGSTKVSMAPSIVKLHSYDDVHGQKDVGFEFVGALQMSLSNRKGLEFQFDTNTYEKKQQSHMTRSSSWLFVSLLANALFVVVLMATSCHGKQLSVFTSKNSESKKRNAYIAGGSLASDNEFPFLVSIQLIDSSATSTTHFCGGSIIAPNVILSAAHCFFDGKGAPLSPSTVQVVAGRTNNYCPDISQCNYGIAQSIHVHPNYNQQTLLHDIAILVLDRNLQIDGSSTRLAFIESGSVPVTKNLAVQVAGWGYIDSTNTVQTNLRKVSVPVVSAATCNQGATFPNQICAGDGAGHDSCSGDSGGPLFRALSGTKDFVVIGVVSYGPAGCGAGYETNRGVYTNTTYYLDSFIRQYVSSSTLQTNAYNETKVEDSSSRTSMASKMSCELLLLCYGMLLILSLVMAQLVL